MESSKETPFVSIIIPVFNRADLLQETLESVSRQSYSNWECIIVDDGSTDASTEVAGRYVQSAPGFVFFARNTLQKGASVCRNLGLSSARGDMLLFLDSDDLLAPGCLEKRLESVSKQPDCDFWIFNLARFHEHPGDSSHLFNIRTDEDALSRFFRMDVPWGVSSTLWNREYLLKLGGFDDSLPSWQDWEIHVRALLKGARYHWFPNEPDAFYRSPQNRETIGKNSLHENNLTAYSRLIQTLIFQDHPDCLRLPGRRAALAQLVFWISEQWQKKEQTEEAGQAWQLARSLVSAPHYLTGLIFFSTRYPAIRKAAHFVGSRSGFFAKMTSGFSGTMLQQTHQL